LAGSEGVVSTMLSGQVLRLPATSTIEIARRVCRPGRKPISGRSWPAARVDVGVKRQLRVASHAKI
jgi:hypothetical protein